MRIIVFGVGAIGGTVAAALAMAGTEVVGIARGRMLDAVQRDGLLLRTPDWERRVRFPCVADPAEIAFRPDDAIILTMKSQDTAAALQRLRQAGVTTQAIACAQNGVNNERLALRLFPNVYGITVMMPGDYLVPGEVNNASAPKRGIFDLGRYPDSLDGTAEQLAAVLEGAGIATFLQPQVMRSKYGKLLVNLQNVIEAALGPDADRTEFFASARSEAEAVYAAAGIDWSDVGVEDARRAEAMQRKEIAGAPRFGGSSTQSLARGAGSIETDYLNGEIALLGRLRGVPVPVNTALTALGHRLVKERIRPGELSPAELRRWLAAQR